MLVIKLKGLAEIVLNETCSKFHINIETVETKTIGLRSGERKFEELMTLEESEFAYDSGYMYIVLDSLIGMKLKVKYNKYTKANVKSYNSVNTEPINKDMLKRFILKERLICVIL